MSGSAVARPMATTLVRCRICGIEFSCPVNQAPRREVCTPEHQKRHDCRCCYCRWCRLRESSKLIDSMSHKEALVFLAVAKKQRGNFYLAFRLAIDGMMFLAELLQLKASDIVSSATGCHVMLPMPRKKDAPKVKVELADCETVELLAKRLAGRNKGNIFEYSKRTFQRAFRKAVSSAGLLDYTFMTLRQTGISIRAAQIRSGSDAEAVRKAARLFSMESLTPYMPKDVSAVPLTKRIRKLR